MKNFFLVLLLALLPLFSACDVGGNMHMGNNIDSIGVANIDGSRFKMVAEGNNPLITPDSKKIIFSGNGLYSINMDGSNLTRLTKDPYVYNLLLSPDGTKVAFITGFGKTINLINTDGSGLRQLHDSKLNKKLLSFSGDGSMIFFAGADSGSYNKFKYLASVDLNGNYKLLTTDTTSQGFGNVQISPDGNYAVFLRGPAGYPYLFSRDLKTQKDRFLLEFDPVFFESGQPVKFISQSTFLYVYDHTLYSYDLLNGEKRSYITIPSNDFHYSQDGTKMFYIMDGKKLVIESLDGSPKTSVEISLPSNLNSYTISPDYRKVIFTASYYKYLD